jgi:hypothetical protein
VEWLNIFFTRPSLSTGIDFNLPVSSNIPEFSFASATEDEVCIAVLSIKSNENPLSFIKSFLPILLGTLTHVFNQIFFCSEFPARWRVSVMLSIPKVAVPVKFLDYYPIDLIV